MESYSEMDLYYIMVIFHFDDFKQYVLLPVFHQMILGLNLPVGHFKRICSGPLHFFLFLHRFFLA